MQNPLLVICSTIVSHSTPFINHLTFHADLKKKKKKLWNKTDNGRDTQESSLAREASYRGIKFQFDGERNGERAGDFADFEHSDSSSYTLIIRL